MHTDLNEKQDWQLLAGLYCLLFGLIFILNIHPIGDGMWYWYATDFRAGEHLYSQMHLPLQPLFVLLTALDQRLFGPGWLASKVLAVLQLVLYVFLIMRVVRKLSWRDWQKALLITAVFQVTLVAAYFRFDDYHITGYCLGLACVLLLMRLRSVQSAGALLALAALIGVCCGLCTANRLNDGGALLVSCILCVALMVPRHRLAAILVALGSSAAVMVSIIMLTHDGLGTWFSESIVRAAKIKGTSNSLVTAVLHFPYTMLKQFLIDPWQVCSFAVLSAFIWATLRLVRRYRESGSSRAPLAVSVAVVVLLGLLLLILARREEPTDSLGYIGVPIAYGLTLWALWLLVQHWRNAADTRWHNSYALLAIPALQLISGSVTSGKSVLETYPPLAILLLLAPFLYTEISSHRRYKFIFVVFCACVTVTGSEDKLIQPYHWHHYRDRVVFRDRVWYQHPKFGPMYVDMDQLALMRSFCGQIDASPSGGMLSLPFPYPNYFCGLEPWHGFVQTWYDTSGKEQIDRLRGDLTSSPPEWIVYQRSDLTMRLHEMVFLGGRPLPHRDLDKLIMNRIASGQWKLTEERSYDDADWMLIHTRP